MTHETQSEAGFSLAELLVAMLVTMLVSGAVFGLISAGQGAGNLVRIGHLGATARPMLAVAGLAALGQGLRDLGVDLDVGAGLAAALEALSGDVRTPVAAATR